VTGETETPHRRGSSVYAPTMTRQLVRDALRDLTARSAFLWDHYWPVYWGISLAA